MLNEIPNSRLVGYLIALGLLPIIFSFIYINEQLGVLSDLKNQLPVVQELASISEGKLSQNRVVRAHFANADHFYIDKHIESLVLLEDEVRALEKLAESSTYGNHQAIKNRIDFLTGNDNRLVFTEGVVQSYPGFQETQESLLHTVEVNEEDLRHILSRIEGIDIGDYSPGPNRPQLIITDFKIDKKNTFANNEVFILNLKLLKREFL